MSKIYFDYAATAPCDPEVIKALEPFLYEKFGNASSPHSLGRDALKAMEDSRETVARFIGAKPEEVVFNSGATEGNNHAIGGIAYSLMERGDHIIVSSIEHHSVLEPVEQLEKDGFRVTYIPVDEDGVVSVDEIEKAIDVKTVLIAVMHASNEIGTIQPIQEISKVAKEHSIPFLVDACQSVGHIPVDVNELGCDLMSFSAHKFYGPKGVGALYIREGTKVSPFLLGGDQERSQRASTQNVAGVVGMAKAISLAQDLMVLEAESQSKLRDKLIAEVPKIVDGVKVNGHLSSRLPNNAHFSFENLEGESLLMSLDMNGIAASMGSACTSGAMEPSHVLRAIGLSDELAYGSLRITLGRWTKEEDIDFFLEKLPELVTSLRI